MQQSLPSTVKVLGFALAVSFVTACAAYPPIAGAQGNVGTNIPVLVMGEDEDPTSVRRSSDIFKRVITELQVAMQRDGFRMIDEESVAADLEWPISDRRSKRDLIERIKGIADSGKASHQVRAWVLFRIHAQKRALGDNHFTYVRIDGEIYDAASNQKFDGFELPRKRYPVPPDCPKICISEYVGKHAREIAADLGVALAKKLKRYSRPKSEVGAGHGMITPYTFTLRYFGYREAETILRVMTDEFPGFVSLELTSQSAAIRRYAYRTTAKAFKLEEWLYILLRDMDFTEDDFLVQVHREKGGVDIIVDKLIPTPDRPASPDETSRFK